MKKFTKLNTTLRIYGVYEIMITSYAININETYQDKRNNMPMVWVYSSYGNKQSMHNVKLGLQTVKVINYVFHAVNESVLTTRYAIKKTAKGKNTRLVAYQKQH